MAIFERGDVKIHYTEHGSGFPVLLIAPGGMRSAIKIWDNAPWNPIDHLSGSYRVVAMDQRNAGESTAPITAADGWDSYTADQLGLLDHLGIDRFGVLGMCIGGPYIANLIKTAPDRVAAAVCLQPIGLDGNREAFHEMFQTWADNLATDHPDTSEETWRSFRDNLYGGDNLLFTVSPADITKMTTPILVMMGNDLHHPQSASRGLAGVAPNATLIEQWRQGEDRDRAMQAVTSFLAEHLG